MTIVRNLKRKKNNNKSKMNYLKKELKLLKESCKDSTYWNERPKRRAYLVEYEEKERYYDNLVLESLKDYDETYERKFRKKVYNKSKNKKKEITEKQKESPLQLIIKAIELLNSEEEKDVEIEMKELKLVDYSDTDNEADDESEPDTGFIVEESEEEELMIGQAPMYLLPEKFKWRQQ
jgi:hypothetical protein